MNTRLRTLITLAAAALCLGCATPAGYEATVLSPDEGALVSGSIRAFPLLKVVLMAVDGKPRLGWGTRTAQALLLDPGERVLRIRGEYMAFQGLPISGSAEVEFSLHLEAGHGYQLLVERDDRLLTFWIEDSATHAAVTERQTRKATVRVILGGPSGLPH